MWVEKHGPSYRIRDTVAGRKVTVESGFPNKTLAKQRKTRLETDKMRGDLLVHGGGGTLVREWVEMWWPPYDMGLKESAKVSSRGIRDRYILPMIGHLTLDELDPLAVQNWALDLREGRQPVRPHKTHKTPQVAKPLSRKTAANAHGLLHQIMDAAVAQKLIRSNPCVTTRLGQKTHHEMVFLTEQEAERLVAAIRPHYRALVLTLLGTGLRWGEAVGLRVKDVDVLGKKIVVRRNLQELADTGRHIEEAPKSEAGRRTIAITASLASVLIPLVSGKDAGEHVFTAPAGGDVRYRVFWPLFDAARDAAGIPACRLHDLRHTHAAWLISARIRGGLTAVQRRLGHSSYRVTSDLYGHLMPEVDDDIITAIDARLPEALFGLDADGGVGGVVGGLADADLAESVQIPDTYS